MGRIWPAEPWSQWAEFHFLGEDFGELAIYFNLEGPMAALRKAKTWSVTMLDQAHHSPRWWVCTRKWFRNQNIGPSAASIAVALGKAVKCQALSSVDKFITTKLSDNIRLKWRQFISTLNASFVIFNSNSQQIVTLIENHNFDLSITHIARSSARVDHRGSICLNPQDDIA